LFVIFLFLVLNLLAGDWEYQNLKFGRGGYCIDIGDARNDGIFRVYWGGSPPNPEIKEYEYNIEAATWTEKESFLPGTSPMTNGISIGKGKNDGDNYIYFAVEDQNEPIGRVYERLWSGSNWTTVEIATAALSMTDIAVGNANYLNNTSDQQIYVGNADGHVYMYSWNGTSYNRIIVGTATAGITAIAIGKGLSDSVSYRCVYAVSSDSHVYQFRWNTSGYFEKVIVGTAPATLNDIAVWNKSGDYEQLFVAASNGHIYGFQYGASWEISDLGQSDSADPMIKVVVGEGRNDGVKRVYAVAQNDALYEFSYSGSWIKNKIVRDIADNLAIGEARNVSGLNSILVRPNIGGNINLAEFCYDSVAPSVVTSLTAETGSSISTVKLSWLSPGDDGTIGIIWNDSVNSNSYNWYNSDMGRFRIDYATYPKTWNYVDYKVEIATITSYGNFNSYIVSGLLDAVTYYFCVWTCDNVGNWSENSNISTATAGSLSGTYIYNTISSDTIWRKSNSPYIINTDITINSGVTLTIEAGVTIKFRGNYKITNKGFMNAQGTPSDNINFTYYISSAVAPGRWNQIYIDGGSGGHIYFDYCNINAAEYGIYFSSGNVQNKIYNSVISSCTTGIDNTSWIASPDILIDGCTFSDCGIGTTVNRYAITDCYFVKNSTAVRSARGTVSNSLFENNYSAIYNPGSQPSGYFVTKSSFISNTNYAFYAEIDLTYCYFENNGVAAYVYGNRKTVGNTLTGNTTGVFYVLSGGYSENEFHHNNFNGSTFYDLFVNASKDITISYNWWGTTITTNIEQKIDNNSYYNITYTPVLTSPYVYSDSPESVTDLAVLSSSGGEVKLYFTTPGDDNGAYINEYTGKYRLKITINSSCQWDVSDYNREISFTKSKSETSEIDLAGLDVGTTYYFALWVSDDSGNWSQKSNVISSFIPFYKISGYIKTNSSSPLEGIEVNLSGAENSSTTYTNSSGYYEFSELIKATYTVTPSGAYVFSPVTYSTSSVSADISNWDFFAVSAPYSISGYVLSYDSSPVANVVVSLSGIYNKGIYRNTPTPVNNTFTTSESGYFSFSLLEGGDFTVTATKENYVFDDISFNNLTVSISTANFHSKLPPQINVSTDFIDFGEITKGESSSQTIFIENTGKEILKGTATVNQSWLTVSPATFESNNIELTITAKAEDNDGQYTGKLTITSNGGEKVIDIQITATCILTRPNPWNTTTSNSLVFFGSGVVPYNTKINIYTLSGDLVTTLNETQGIKTISWDGRNKWGEKVVPGIYIYTYESSKEKSSGQFTVIK